MIYDRHGTFPAFTEHFHKLIAKCQNALRGRWENMWSSQQVCVVRLVDPADVMSKLVYAATNPVKDRLVERVHHWPVSMAWPRCSPSDRCTPPDRDTSSAPTARCPRP